MTMANRAYGMLLGSMVGDALGAAFEGEGSASIRRGCLALGLPCGAPIDMVDSRKLPDVVASAQAVGLDLSAKENTTGQYTDDTECTLALAESLIVCGGLHTRHAALNMAWWWLRPPYRGGYSSYTFQKLAALARGGDTDVVGAMHNDKFPGGKGSWGNGGAMRIAPLGIVYRHLFDAPDAMRTVVKAALASTHTHPEAIDASLVIATAVAQLSMLTDDAVLDPVDFLLGLCKGVKDKELLRRLRALAEDLRMQRSDQKVEPSGGTNDTDDQKETDTPYFCAYDKALLQRVCTPGKWFQIRAVDAVAYVLYVLAKYGGLDKARGLGTAPSSMTPSPQSSLPSSSSSLSSSSPSCTSSPSPSPEACLVRMVALGGDTDTLACMLGACLGALYGGDWVPKRWLAMLESDKEFGLPAVKQLAPRLANVRVPSALGTSQSTSKGTLLVDPKHVEIASVCQKLVDRMAVLPLHKRHELS